MLYLARKSESEKMESCYNLFEKHNWDLTKFYNDTDLFIEEVRKNAREYAKKVLNISLTKEQIWCLMPRNVRVLFNEHDSIIKEMLKFEIINRNDLMDIDWMINNLKVNISKFCYEICEEHKWINANIEEYCVKRDIAPISFKVLARQYMLDVLRLDEVQQDEHWNKRLAYRKNHILNNENENNGVFSNLYLRLSETEDKDEIIKIFTELNREYYLIKHCLTDFLISYNIPSDKRKNVFDKLNIYSNYLKENRKLEDEIKKAEKEKKYIEENIDKARLIIGGYLDSQYEGINQYCKAIKLERRIFDKYLDLVKNNDEKLYNNYLKHIENNKNKIYEDLLSRSLIVIDLIKQGVIENGNKREFDLVDYYKYLPLGFDRMLRIVREGINPEDYKLLSSYVGKYKNERELSDTEINNIYNMKTIVNVQSDEENKAILGTGREITIQEKQNIINYLKTNNIPVTHKTYNIIYRRWLSGELVLETEKDKTK